MNDSQPLTPDIDPEVVRAATADPDALLSEFDAQLAEITQASSRYSLFRLLTFLGVVAGLILSVQSNTLAGAVAIPSLGLFFVVLAVHLRLLHRKKAIETRRVLVEERRARRDTRKQEKQAPPIPDSELPLDVGHRVYAPEESSFAIDDGLASDLDLFDASRPLFGFLDTTSSLFGARRLRVILSHLLLEPPAIEERQRAVERLANDHGLRQTILESLLGLRGRKLEATPRFLRSEPQFAKLGRVVTLANVMGTLSVIVGLLAVTVDPMTYLPFFIALVLVNLGIVGTYVKRSNLARDRVLVFGPLLDGLHHLDTAFSRGPDRCRDLDRIRDALAHLRPANRGLRRYVHLLELHGYGTLFEAFNVITLWELRFVPFAERLLLRHSHEIEQGLGGLSEAEALAALACPLAEHDTFTLPRPVTGDVPRVEAEQIGHPLIEEDQVVRNDFRLGGDERVMIVTGSNMAGKSTYLKSVGANLLLASAGGPVCAKSFAWTPVNLYSDMNVRDSLDDGKSYFQVEVERVHEVIRTAGTNPFVLAIFDELFRGTNSDERLALARSILRHLRGTGCLLVVATHDNLVTELVTDDNEPGMVNFHFQETVTDGVMSFDYRIHEGPAKTRNAIRVLDSQGYPKEIIEQARREAGHQVT